MDQAAPIGLEGGLHVIAVEVDDGGRLAPASATKGRPRRIDLIDARRENEDRARKPTKVQAWGVRPEEQRDAGGGFEIEIRRDQCPITWMSVR